MIEKTAIQIWGRDFILPVDYDCYEGEVPTPEQIKAFELFIPESKAFLTKAQKAVEDYCRDQVLCDSSNEKKDNIFSYVKPDFFLVKREDKPHIVLCCHYRYDEEHGLAIVFLHNGTVKVGNQDMVSFIEEETETEEKREVKGDK